MSDVHNAPSSQFCSAPVNSSCLWLLLWSQLISYLVFLYFWCFLCFFQPSLHPPPSHTHTALLYFPKTLPDIPKVESFSFVTFASGDILGLICARTHLLTFWWPKVYIELYPTPFAKCIIFPIRLVHCLTFILFL